MHMSDKAPILAKEFCEKHGFDEETRASLQDQLQEKINKVLQMKAYIKDKEESKSTP